MKYRYVLFDFDGTLADTFPWLVSAIRGAAQDFRFRELQADEVESLRSVGTRQVLERLGIANWKVPKIANALRRRMARDIDQIHLFVGVADLIERLQQQGRILAIVSSNSEANIRRVLGPELGPRFAHVDAGVSMFGKAPRLRKAVRRLGAQAQQVVYIGDELRDLEAARKAGIACGLVDWGFAHRETLEQAGPDAVFAAPSEIATWLLGTSPVEAQGPQGAT